MMWAARDEDGRLWLYFKEPPIKLAHEWGATMLFCEASKSDDIPSISWADKQPTPVEYNNNKKLIIKTKKHEQI